MSHPSESGDAGYRPSLLNKRAREGLADNGHSPPLRMLAGLDEQKRSPLRGRRNAGAAADVRPTQPTKLPASSLRATDSAWRWGMVSLVALVALGVTVGGVDWSVLETEEASPDAAPQAKAATTVAASDTGPVLRQTATIENLPADEAQALPKDGLKDERKNSLRDNSPFARLEPRAPGATSAADTVRHGGKAGPPANAAGPFAALERPVLHQRGQTTEGKRAAVSATPAPVAVPVRAQVASAPIPTPAAALPASPAPTLPATATLSPAQKRQAARDADVALLTAMIAHVSTHSGQETNGAMPPLRLPGGRSAPLTTIAQIVEHCRKLEGEEAKICKVRICENYWGKDDACRTHPDFHKPEPH